jgi:hypothetical protein
MKPIVTTFVLICTLAAAPLVSAESFAIDWFTIDGGGGTSTGGVYSVNGTIGQPDAGRITGGNYSLAGGFWAIFAAMQTPGTPLLRIATTATNTLVVAWPASSEGFSLEESVSLSTPNWMSVTTMPAVVGDENQVIIPHTAGTRFYRLARR